MRGMPGMLGKVHEMFKRVAAILPYVMSMLNYRELNIADFHLLVVEARQKVYRLYVGRDGKQYCHYDTGRFESLDDAVMAASKGFNPEPFLLFPFAPYSREEALERAPDAFDDLLRRRESK